MTLSRKRLFLRTALVTLSSAVATGPASAQWSATILHPAGKSESQLYGGAAGRQVGYAFVGGIFHASVWSGTPESWIDLHPAGAELSVATSLANGIQYGYALISGEYCASAWSGTAESWVNLTPATATAAVIFGASTSEQVGYATIDGKFRAARWSGTAASWVDLDPVGSDASTAHASFSAGSTVTEAGVVRVAGIDRAALWSGTAGSWVDLHPESASASTVYGVYGGRQAGFALIGSDEHASVWTGTASSWVDLNPAGSSASTAYGAYGDHQIGYATFDGKRHAGFWSGLPNTWEDLQSVLPADFDSSVAKGMLTDGANDYVFGYGHNTTTFRTEAILWKRPSVLIDTFELTLNKSVVAGQNSVQGTITATISSGTARLYTTYDNSSLVTTPPSVTLAAGTFVKNFQITVTAGNSPINTTIFAKRGAVTRSQPLTLTPLVPTALAFTPNPVIGGQTTQGKVVINGVAGPGGRTISLFDNSAYAETPKSVVVPPGASSVTFPITTSVVTSAKSVTVTARVSAGEKTGTFRINP